MARADEGCCRGIDVLIDSLFRRQSTQRIFISYRREDSQWAAGRLSDSLEAYFGDDRVFRDIEDIAGGADFGDVIHETLGAADAVVVLIGANWLGASDARGNRRLDDAEDWVAREVAAALEKGLPVYPVLLEDTPMPRASELPEALWPLTRYNAVSISDRRWQGDVARLAKIVALDIPSATERTLRAINAAISTALFLAIAFTLSVLFWNLMDARPVLDGDTPGEWKLGHLFAKIDGTDACEVPADAVVRAPGDLAIRRDLRGRGGEQRPDVRVRPPCRCLPPGFFPGGGLDRGGRRVRRLSAVPSAVRGVRGAGAVLHRPDPRLR